VKRDSHSSNDNINSDLIEQFYLFFSASGCPLANRNKKLGLGLDGTTTGNGNGGEAGSCAGDEKEFFFDYRPFSILYAL
jgi:hypothetical protein